MSERPEIGDYVQWDLSASHGGGPDRAVVIAEMKSGPCYDGSRILLVADEKYIGMPINEGHLTVLPGGKNAYPDHALKLRERYEKMCPGYMRPL